jgi:hypothetical protein
MSYNYQQLRGLYSGRYEDIYKFWKEHNKRNCRASNIPEYYFSSIGKKSSLEAGSKCEVYINGCFGHDTKYFIKPISISGISNDYVRGVDKKILREDGPLHVNCVVRIEPNFDVVNDNIKSFVALHAVFNEEEKPVFYIIGADKKLLEDAEVFLKKIHEKYIKSIDSEVEKLRAYKDIDFVQVLSPSFGFPSTQETSIVSAVANSYFSDDLIDFYKKEQEKKEIINNFRKQHPYNSHKSQAAQLIRKIQTKNGMLKRRERERILFPTFV